MSIVSTTTKVYAVKPYLRITTYKPCSACVNSDALVQVGSRTREDYTVEHRSHPDDLFSSVTARPKIRTIDHFWGADKARKSVCTASGTCYANQYAWFSKVLSYGFKGDASDDVPVTDWEIDVREAIEARRQNIAESLYEWKQTSGMVVGGAKLLRTGWDVWRGRLPKGKRGKITPCHAATAELTASFGVNPLLMETKEAYERLTDKVGVGVARRIRTTTKRETIQNVSASLFTGEYRWRRMDKVSLLVRYKEIAPAVFTAGAPWELAYELTPFSWLVDGFVDLGSYLGSLDAMFDVKWVKGTLTRRDKKLAYGEGKRYTTSTIVKPEWYREKTYERIVLNSVPQARFPRFAPTENWRKLMHAVSALVVLNDRCSKRPRRTVAL